ncbi:unnamed protein product [Triticum turgidum subsp. durum]|uniref:Uncharacterized protein n=2 Tax=Triticum TaxID=4564 RepID=A0A9R1QY40_TRITD|nr:unnamed protein product [Triticum aestivum]VAH85560.1 unnamed protein product [Triticum turgidum subsp. durum]
MLPPPSLPAEEAHPLSRSMSPAVATPEACNIVEGQRYSKKLNDKQVTNILRASLGLWRTCLVSQSQFHFHEDSGNAEKGKHVDLEISAL